jgi:two-component system, sensor histidine kinase PdtaS
MPIRPRSRAVHFVLTTLLVGAFFLFVVGIQDRGRPEGFFILLPTVFIVSVLYGLGCAIYAAGLSTALLYALVLPPHTLLVPARFALPLILFLLLAVGLAILSDGLRAARDRATVAERAKDLLLRELGHRTKNNFAMTISLLSLQLRSKNNPEVREALTDAIGRIKAIANAHDYLQPSKDHGLVEMRAYLETLCARLSDASRDLRPIAIEVEADEVYLETDRAVAAGLIVNELVTNALKHAFPGNRGGTVKVILKKTPSMRLVVEDDGVGYSAKQENMGSILTRRLAQQLGGAISWDEANPGCRASIAFPGL